MNYELKHFDTTLVRFSATEDTNTPEIKILWRNDAKKDCFDGVFYKNIFVFSPYAEKILVLGSLFSEKIYPFHIWENSEPYWGGIFQKFLKKILFLSYMGDF